MRESDRREKDVRNRVDFMHYLL